MSPHFRRSRGGSLGLDTGPRASSSCGTPLPSTRGSSLPSLRVLRGPRPSFLPPAWFSVQTFWQPSGPPTRLLAYRVAPGLGQEGTGPCTAPMTGPSPPPRPRKNPDVSGKGAGNGVCRAGWGSQGSGGGVQGPRTGAAEPCLLPREKPCPRQPPACPMRAAGRSPRRRAPSALARAFPGLLIN